MVDKKEDKRQKKYGKTILWGLFLGTIIYFTIKLYNLIMK